MSSCNRRKTYHLDASKEGTTLANLLGEGTSIDAVNRGDVVIREPLGQGLLCGPMGVLPRVRTDDEAGNVDAIRLKVFGQSMVVDDGLVGDTVVADEGVGEDEDLATVGRVRQGLGVADHAGVEHDLTGDGGVGTEGTSLEGGRAIGQVQVGLGALLYFPHLFSRIDFRYTRKMEISCLFIVISWMGQCICILSIFMPPNCSLKKICKCNCSTSRAGFSHFSFSTENSPQGRGTWKRRGCCGLPLPSWW